MILRMHPIINQILTIHRTAREIPHAILPNARHIHRNNLVPLLHLFLDNVWNRAIVGYDVVFPDPVGRVDDLGDEEDGGGGLGEDEVDEFFEAFGGVFGFGGGGEAER